MPYDIEEDWTSITDAPPKGATEDSMQSVRVLIDDPQEGTQIGRFRFDEHKFETEYGFSTAQWWAPLPARTWRER